MRIDKIVLHCSDSPHGRGDNAETIHHWHLEKNWSGIGYHFVITEEGDIEPGRPIYWTGAHVRGHNKNSVGICLIGDHTFTDAQRSKLFTLIEALLADFPDALVLNHRDLDPGKTCPNADLAGEFYLHLQAKKPLDS